MERSSPASDRFCGWAAAARAARSAPAARFRFCFDGSGLLLERGTHKRLVRLELLPNGTAHGGWPVLRLHWPCIHDHSAGDLFGRSFQTAVDTHLLGFLSHYSPVWRKSGRGSHGPLRVAAREAALESP